jgi:hypothetical protein
MPELKMMKENKYIFPKFLNPLWLYMALYAVLHLFQVGFGGLGSSLPGMVDCYCFKYVEVRNKSNKYIKE